MSPRLLVMCRWESFVPSTTATTQSPATKLPFFSDLFWRQMAVYKTHQQQCVILSWCYLLTWKGLRSTKAFAVPYSQGRNSQYVLTGAIGDLLLFIDRRQLRRNMGPVTSSRKLGWWHSTHNTLGQKDGIWEEQVHTETSLFVSILQFLMTTCKCVHGMCSGNMESEA